MLHRRTTGSSSVAIKTGSTYICHSMRDIITISTVNLLRHGELAESVNK